jgi:hypothetical protein
MLYSALAIERFSPSARPEADESSKRRCFDEGERKSPLNGPPKT